tara:strand:- start:551 stop:838 length:288 start_codon:yes stop_codon:yes gene_type:complete
MINLNYYIIFLIILLIFIYIIIKKKELDINNWNTIKIINNNALEKFTECNISEDKICKMAKITFDRKPELKNEKCDIKKTIIRSICKPFPRTSQK